MEGGCSTMAPTIPIPTQAAPITPHGLASAAHMEQDLACIEHSPKVILDPHPFPIPVILGAAAIGPPLAAAALET